MSQTPEEKAAKKAARDKVAAEKKAARQAETRKKTDEAYELRSQQQQSRKHSDSMRQFGESDYHYNARQKANSEGRTLNENRMRGFGESDAKYERRRAGGVRRNILGGSGGRR